MDHRTNLNGSQAVERLGSGGAPSFERASGVVSTAAGSKRGPKVITRMVGGLGNQMFSYAAARRLALANDAELILDTVSGFERDQFGRRFQLDAFNIAGREATSRERFLPFPRARRAVLRWVSHWLPFQHRPYVQQEGLDFDARLLGRHIGSTMWLEGIWVGDGYFRDIADTIRSDFSLRSPPTDGRTVALAEQIQKGDSVGLHVRWFDGPDSDQTQNITTEYYMRAVAEMRSRMASARLFVFSDDPDATRRKLDLGVEAVFVEHNDTDDGAIADFWLLQKCRHFIIANSTFSWWAAWLGASPDSVVICPSPERTGAAGWRAKGFLPESWLKI